MKKPYSPLALLIISVLLTPVVSVYAAGKNYKFFGNEKAAKNCFYGAGFLLVLLLLLPFCLQLEFVLSIPDSIFSAIFRGLNTGIGIWIWTSQKDEYKKWKQQSGQSGASLWKIISAGILIVILYSVSVFILVKNVAKDAGIPTKDMFELGLDMNTQDGKDYLYAVENGFLTGENTDSAKGVELIRPFYERKKDDPFLGGEVSFNFALMQSVAGNADKARDILDGFEAKYPEFIKDEESRINLFTIYLLLGTEFINQRNGEKSFPLLLKAYNLKESVFKERETMEALYHNLTIAAALMNDELNADKYLNEGLSLYPDSELLQGLAEAATETTNE